MGPVAQGVIDASHIGSSPWHAFGAFRAARAWLSCQDLTAPKIRHAFCSDAVDEP